MGACPSCGRDLPEEFPFCPFCAAPLRLVGESMQEQRKTVTVLFCDLTGSTALGEATDPEALRALLARYFERMKGTIEGHGGSVEKFIGDAVMAVFGVPVAHEDDALRACRAAVEMRNALPELGLTARIGVNTGEVVTGTQERLATGDAVNVAARLEQAARPGEVLIGDETLRLVRGAVDVGEQRLLEVKGKSGSLAAYSLRAVTGEIERRFATAMIGRETELRRLRDAFQQAVRDRSCQLFTILGSAGVGKSRLATEFLAGVEATVVRGRCLSYGEGITYWPIVEILRDLGSLPEGEAARPLRSLLGEADPAGSAEEIAWAFRKLLEQEAATRPLVCVLDDLHWAEETLLDLIEHIADISRDSPILLLCMARPEFLELRASWGGGKWNATTVLLEPLDADETGRLLDELGEVPPDLRVRIAEVAEGNPLFLEEMLALVRESGDERVEVPATIQALLTARLDQLDHDERAVLERGSVEGRTFHRGAVAALTGGDGSIDQRLLALVRKELVRPERPQLPGDDDAYRFRHLLIRDTAYEALPKALRADLHERFAGWLAEQVGERQAEYEAVIGHHLEQAYRFRRELGRDDQGLAERAGHTLARAGRAALARRDAHAALGLLTRAVDLLGSDQPERTELVIALGQAAFDAGDYRRASEMAEELIQLGRQRGDSRLEQHGHMQAIWVRTFTDPSVTMNELEATGRAAIPALETAHDEAGLARAYHLLAHLHQMRSDTDEHIDALERALDFAQRAGDTAHEAEIMSWLAVDYFFGSTPVDQARTRLEQLLAEARSKSMLALEGVTVSFLGGIAGIQGQFDKARELFRHGRAILAEMDLKIWLAGQSQMTGYIELLAGDYVAAEREFRFGYDEYERIGETSIRSTNAAMLAEALYEQGRLEEAEGFLQVCRETAPAEDWASQIAWRATAARLLAQREDLVEAERVAREAVALAGKGAGLFDADAWSSLGETLALSGKHTEAEEAIATAIHLHEQKGNSAGAARTRKLAAILRPRLT